MTKNNNNMRVAIVTGGNRGIGYEVCKNLSEIGFKVILTSRKVEDGIKAVDKINNNVSYFPLDVTLQDDIEKLKNHIIDQFGRLDILINNAGILLDKRGYGKGKISSIFDTDINVLRESIETNSIAPFALCKALIPIMKKNNYGRVVNVSSQAGQLASESYGIPCYRMSKTALNSVTRIFADETKKYNILVNSVCPVWAKTIMGGPNAIKEAKDSIGTIIWAATLSDGEGSGKFFQEFKEIPW
mgnify:CR=1 FL=1